MTLRNILKQHRLHLSPDVRHAAELRIHHGVIHADFFKNAQHVAIYMTHLGEVNTQEIIQAAWAMKKNIYLPVLNSDKTISFFLYHKNDVLKKNAFDIVEPENKTRCLSPENLDIVFVPLLGFDIHLTRLGYGMGCYDRTFAFLQKNPEKKPLLVGLAFECQKVKSLERKSWDIPLNKIITEENIYELLADEI